MERLARVGRDCPSSELWREVRELRRRKGLRRASSETEKTQVVQNKPTQKKERSILNSSGQNQKANGSKLLDIGSNFP